ncbi:MAG TPA: V-type ATP synthase subunit E, partial [Coriobacteriia bacterium]
MAIDDIVKRIANDADGEGLELTDSARADSARMRSEALARADARTARDAAKGVADAARDAATLLANARLEARDALLTARYALDAEALDAVGARLVALADDRYAALLARGIAEAADGCGSLRLGTADAERLRRALPGALKVAGVTLEIDDAPADIERGVVLAGDRVRVEVSAAAMIKARRDDLLSGADAALFGNGG